MSFTKLESTKLLLVSPASRTSTMDQEAWTRSTARVGLTLVALCCAAICLTEAVPEPAKLVDERIGSITQCLQMINTLKQTSQAGLAEHQAVLTLEPILNLVRDSEGCTGPNVELMADFHSRFIVGPESRDLPQAVRDFFYALGYQLSIVCQLRLVARLRVDSEEAGLGEEDYGRLEAALAAYPSRVIAAPVRHYTRLALMRHTRLTTPRDQLEARPQLAIMVRELEPLVALAVTCERKFAPFYEQLVWPLVRLADLGFDYDANMPLMRERREPLSTEPLYARWYQIAQVCDLLHHAEVFEATSSANQGELAPGEFRAGNMDSQQVEQARKQYRSLRTLMDSLGPEAEVPGSATPVKRVSYVSPAKGSSSNVMFFDSSALGPLVRATKPELSQRERAIGVVARRFAAELEWEFEAELRSQLKDEL